MANVRTSRKFRRLSDTELSNFTAGNIVGFTANPDLDDPPVTAAQLKTRKTTFDDAVQKASQGGRMLTAAKNAARRALLADLNKDASYVDIACDDDLTILLSSGFDAVSTNRAQRVLPAPQIIAVDNAQSGQLKVRVKGNSDVKSFVGRIKEADGGEFGPVLSFKNSRTILFDALKAGALYVVELCAIGGITGKSDWSEPATKRAM